MHLYVFYCAPEAQFAKHSSKPAHKVVVRKIKYSFYTHYIGFCKSLQFQRQLKRSELVNA